jgi:AcrR family transcriptional regulator
MTRGADLTSQPRALRSRQTILEAAGAEFIERRFAAATLKGVASRAGLTTAPGRHSGSTDAVHPRHVSGR